MNNPPGQFLVLLLLWLLSFPVAAETLQAVSLQLKWKHDFQFAGFYIAKQKGFYRDAGLDVEIREVQANTDVVAEVLSGRANYGISDSALVLDRMAGKPVIALAAILQHSPLALMTLKSSAIDHPQKLAGRKVMMFANKKTASLSAMLSGNGVDISEIQLQPHSFKLSDLVDGKVDAYEAYTTNQPFLMQQQGIEYNLLKPQDYGFDFYGDLLFTSEAELTGHSQRTLAFYRASLKGWRYAFEHVEETIRLIQQKYNSQHLSAGHLRYEAATLKQLSGIERGEFSQISQLKIEAIANVFRVLRLQTEPYQLDRFIYKEGQTYLGMAQKSFLQTHEINVITTDNWPPFNIRTNPQELRGIAIDYWNLIRRKTGIRSQTKITNKWLDVIDGIKNKTADITLSTGITEDRKAFALFTKPYVSFPIAFATTNDKNYIASVAVIGQRKIAVGKGYSAHRMLSKKHPDLNLLPVSNTSEALRLVSEGQAFAAADILPVLTDKISEKGYSNLKISGATRFNFDVRIMVRDDYPELIGIINEAIDSISATERQTIFNKWVAVKYENGNDHGLLLQAISIFVIVLLVLYAWNRTLKKEIQRRKEAETKLHQIATTDVLTSIHNRYKLGNLLDQQMLLYKRYHRLFSVFYIDLDDFKLINDQHGHETGDIVLVEFANLIQQNIRKSDYFGRWGGEEFLIILPETDLPQAETMANKLLNVVNQHEFSGIGQLTCSIGIAQIMPFDTEKNLINRADQGLYLAKQQGKNRVRSVPAEVGLQSASARA
jgi:polar amino acid transport system substrate-binding protein